MIDKLSTKLILAIMAIAVIGGVIAVVLLLRPGEVTDFTPPPYITDENDYPEEPEETPGIAPLIITDFVPPSQGVNQLVFSNPYNLPTTPHGGNILHAWNMSFIEIIEHLPYIAGAGFGVIQTSPIGASLVRRPNMGTFGRWYDLYQPTHFTIGNYLGTEEEFRELTRLAAELGIFVIIDALPNHTTAYWEEIDTALTEFYPSLFHSRRNENMLTNVWATPMDFGNRRSFVRGNLLGLWDFYTSRPEFQEIYMAFLQNIIDAGASGFRFDAAHHIELPNDPPDIASDFWPVVSRFVDEYIRSLGRIPFQYGEILGAGYRANHYLHGLFHHAHYLITPYAFSNHIRNTLSIGFLTDGRYGWNSYNFHVYGNPRNHADSPFGPGFTAVDLGGFEGFGEGVVPWVESHDQYGNEGVSGNLTNEQILVGWAMIAARQGTSPLFFVRPGEGFVNSGNMFLPQDDGSYLNAWGFQLFYRDPAVAAVNWFANDFINYPEITSTHGNVALIQRGEVNNKTGAVLANVGSAAAESIFKVEMADGVYVCEITGGVFFVLDGWLTGPEIGAMSVVVLRISDYRADDVPEFVGFYVGNDESFHNPGGLGIALIAKHTTTQYVRVSENGTEIINRPFLHGKIIHIGYDSEIGDVFEISIITDAAVSAVMTLTVEEEPEYFQIRVEYVRNENQWAQAGIWAWNARGDVFTGGWPGPQMERAQRLDGEGYAWVFYLPPDTVVPVTIIFNDFGLGEQTVPYLTITQSTRVFQISDGLEIGYAEPIER